MTNENYTKEEYLSQRATLTTTHENVDHINDKMIKYLTSATEHTYNSADSIASGDADQNLYHIEFLNNQNPTGLLPHQLKLKVNTPVILLQNLNPSQGLLNGTRLLIKTPGRRVIQAKIMTEPIVFEQYVKKVLKDGVQKRSFLYGKCGSAHSAAELRYLFLPS
ncbi:hypothetical protein RRG08_018426 [Elysia crispata]|uniref:DNA helicase Pif1-like 2B domain-containing protein n=1 Tax=Elysia crispata TaxID=231223 RepID=A0AAE1BA22_9GAST|nr:hypothetical protein RRG08_018426 [Elysia crispata]